MCFRQVLLAADIPASLKLMSNPRTPASHGGSLWFAGVLQGRPVTRSFAMFRQVCRLPDPAAGRMFHCSEPGSCCLALPPPKLPPRPTLLTGPALEGIGEEGSLECSPPVPSSPAFAGGQAGLPPPPSRRPSSPPRPAAAL